MGWDGITPTNFNNNNDNNNNIVIVVVIIMILTIIIVVMIIINNNNVACCSLYNNCHLTNTLSHDQTPSFCCMLFSFISKALFQFFFSLPSFKEL